MTSQNSATSQKTVTLRIMTPNRLARARSSMVLALMTLPLLLTSCATIWTLPAEEEASAPEQQAAVAPQKKSPQTAARRTGVPMSVSSEGGTAQVGGVEILWQVPMKPVEIYHLNYGFSADRLDRSLTIPIDKLEKFDDPAHGPVFRYRLAGVPSDRDVFVTMRAENHMGVSEPSEVIRVSGRAAKPELTGSQSGS